MKQKLIPALCGAVLFTLTASQSIAQSPPRGFISLFNGKDLTGWKSTGKAEVWFAEKGAIVCNGKGGGWLLTEREFSDFELRFEYKMPKGGNSGVALRTPVKGDPAYAGMEIQLIDDEGWPGKLQSWQHTGSIYNVVPAATTANKPTGNWNRMRIVAKGKQVYVELNGTVLVNANLGDYVKEHGKKHPGLERTSGQVGFQSHDGRVEFRNIHLRPLDTTVAQEETGNGYGGRMGLLARLRHRFGR